MNARRNKHLRPLTEMTVPQIVNHIEGLKLQSLRALARTMDECTTTNCWWGEYRVAVLFRQTVREQMERSARHGMKRLQNPPQI